MNLRFVYADENGHIFVHPEWEMAAASGDEYLRPHPDDWMPVTAATGLFYLPAHTALAWDGRRRAAVELTHVDGQRVFPMAAHPVPGLTRTLLPAARKTDPSVVLPLWPYAAVGWRRGRFYVCAIKTDSLRRQDPQVYRRFDAVIKKSIRLFLKKYPRNRLLRHLSHCALIYNCRNAQNLFLGRGEAPVPLSGRCNARCLGCLSFQESGCPPASHDRIRFLPTVKEVVEAVGNHLKGVPAAMVSFGQGCEGEPLLELERLRACVVSLRRYTSRGRIHLNTNGSSPSGIRELACAGLDSIRVSVNSFDGANYRAYYRPSGYSLADVKKSLKVAKERGLFVSLNLLVFPGVTDQPHEIKALLDFLKRGYVDLLQMRNLSIDPGFYLARVRRPLRKALGITSMIKAIKKALPKLKIGYFNPAR